MCIVTPYTLTGGADTPAAREAACNAAKAGFKPPLPGMLGSLPGSVADFSGARGGPRCSTDSVKSVIENGTEIAYNKSLADMNGATIPMTGVYWNFYNDSYTFNFIYGDWSGENNAWSNPSARKLFKINFINNYSALNISLTVRTAMASAASDAYRDVLAGSWLMPCTTDAACQAVIDNARIPAINAATNAAISVCDAAMSSSTSLVCCNM